MARPLRLEFSGALYHVTSRGDGREDIYLSDDDRERWLTLLGDVCKRFNWLCHAYCLMTNHYHILIETSEGNLSTGMRHLNGVYTQGFNRTHRRVGHVFQGRFKAILIERDAYLLEVARYIVLNPVRAAMVADAGDWPWSSYRAMLADVSREARLNVNGLLRMFGSEFGEARLRYIDFVREGVGQPSVWDSMRGQMYLGDDAFLARMLVLSAQQEAVDEVPRGHRRPVASAIGHYVGAFATAAQRNTAIVDAWATGDFTQQEIARAFGIHYTTVSRIIHAAG